MRNTALMEGTAVANLQSYQNVTIGVVVMMLHRSLLKLAKNATVMIFFLLQNARNVACKDWEPMDLSL